MPSPSAHPAPDRRWSPVRLSSAFVLAAWAALFWYLLVSGEWSLFLAARVDWLVPVAAISFTVGALGRLATARTGDAKPLSSDDGRRLAVAIAPVLIILLLPLGTLSSFAAERRSSFSLAQFSASVPQSGESLTFQQLVGSSMTDEGRAALAERQGETVRLIGMPLSPSDDGFLLTRFVLSCCVVDATVAEVSVRPAEPLAGNEEWVQVEGSLAVDGEGKPMIEQATVVPAEQPDPPYLHPG